MVTTKPTVHLNGTSRSALMKAYEEAQRAVGSALVALHETAPNARDYYPQGPGAVTLAIAEHQARIDRLVDVRTELLELFEACESARRND